MTITPHHLGICVTDLDRSLRFWCEGLGFETTMVPPVGSEWSDALEIGGEVEFTAHFITKAGFTFELLHFTTPRPNGEASATRSQIGFTHLAVDVDDFEGTIAKLEALGGTLIESTRTTFSLPGATIELAFMADPDGVRIELVHQY
ncbi:MAG: VOC family protein [Acidimicrobiales bacterium]